MSDDDDLSPLQCKICYQEFDTKEFIPYAFRQCHHIFCLTCLKDNAEKNRSYGWNFLKCFSCKVETSITQNPIESNFDKIHDFINLTQDMIKHVRNIKENAELLRQKNEELNKYRSIDCPLHKEGRLEHICLSTTCPHPEDNDLCSHCHYERHKECGKPFFKTQFNQSVKQEKYETYFRTFFRETKAEIEQQCENMKNRILSYINSLEDKYNKIVEKIPIISTENFHQNKKHFTTKVGKSQNDHFVLEFNELVDFKKFADGFKFALNPDCLWKNFFAIEKSTMALHFRDYFSCFKNEVKDSDEIYEKLSNTNKNLLTSFYLSDLKYDKIQSLYEFAGFIGKSFDPDVISKKDCKIIQSHKIVDAYQVKNAVQREILSNPSMFAAMRSIERWMSDYFKNDKCKWVCAMDPIGIFPGGQILRYVQFAFGDFRVAIWAEKV